MLEQSRSANMITGENIMYAINTFSSAENKLVILKARILIDNSPFKGLVRLQATDSFVEVDDNLNVTHERDERAPYELCIVSMTGDQHSFRLWRRIRAYRSSWVALESKLSEMRLYK